MDKSTYGKPFREPISLDMPTQEDHEKTKKMVEHLISLNVFPSREEKIHTEEALGKLYQLVKEWYVEEGIKQGLTKELAEEAGLHVETFGSYRLGVHGPGSDIDTLWIFPKHITKKIFFESLKEKLATSPYIQDLNAIPDAYVPIIATKFDGIEIDLLFARLGTTTIPSDFKILSDDNLRDVDEETQRSLRGPRDADLILKLVPNQEHFRTTLRCVKVWASKRAISTQKYGYLGGVSWAILVAFICQLYPNATPNILLNRFFKIYKDWPWRGNFEKRSPRVPILLTEIKYLQDSKLKVWIQKREDMFSMSIITPSYPSMNSTHGVSPSITKILQQEFTRGFDLMEKINDPVECLKKLAEESDFFTQYTNYLEIETSAETLEEKIKWESFIESKIRKLIEKFHELHEDFVIHPYPKSFDKTETNSFVYIGLKLPRSTSNKAEVNVITPIEQFKLEIAKWQHKTIGMHEPKANLITGSQFPDFVIASLSEAQQVKISEKMQRLKEKKEKLLQKQLVDENSQGPTEITEPKVGEKRKEAPGEDSVNKIVKVE